MSANLNTASRPWQDLLDEVQTWAQERPELNWFALVDLAQAPGLRQALPDGAACLFGASPDSPVGLKSPWLASLGRPLADESSWAAILRSMYTAPASVTVLAARQGFESLLRQLKSCLDLLLPDESDDLQLAFWDPAILASLVGQSDDDSLHVPGPILSDSQRASLLHEVPAWWYRGREGLLHRIEPPAVVAEPDGALPFRFEQAQVDQLVEAGVPDLVLFHVRTNQPHLLEAMGASAQYREIRRWVLKARSLGLLGLRDLVNLSCIGLIYGERFELDPEIGALMAQVKAGHKTLDQVMPELPE